MHDAGACHFDPLFAPFKSLCLDVDLETGFGERKIMRAKPHRRVRSEKFVHEKFERAFQVRHTHILIYVEAFDLV